MAIIFDATKAKKLMVDREIETQAELARLADVSPNTIVTTFKNTRTPDLVTVQKIAKVLGVRTFDLLIDESSPAPHHEAPASLAAAPYAR